MNTYKLIISILLCSITIAFAAPGPRLIAIDKFSNNKNGWAISKEAYLKDKSYHIYSQKVHKYSYLRYDLQNGKLGIMTNWQKGSIKTGYGLIFRVQDSSHFYYCLIVQGGYFSFGYFDGAKVNRIVKWKKSNVIRVKNKNYIEIDFNKNTFTGFINKQQVFQATDNKYKKGGFGFLVSQNIHAIFDDMMIWKY